MELPLELKEALGGIQSAIDQKINGLAGNLKETRTQLDSLDERFQSKGLYAGGGDLNIGQKFVDSPEMAVLVKSGRGSARVTFDMSVKTLIDSPTVGRTVTGVLPIDRIQGVVEEARSPLQLLDLISVRPTGLQVVDFVQIITPASAAYQSPEGSTKNESAMTFTSTSRKIVTIATWQPCSRQVLEDGPGLNAAVQGSLRHAVRAELEDQILNGNGAGEAIRGILVDAQSFDTSLLPSASQGWTMLDTIGCAVQQIAGDNEIPPTVAVMNPLDLWRCRMTKDANGVYVLGPPNSPNPPRIWGVLLVGSSAMAEGEFAVGSTDPAALQLVERMGVTLDVSTEHSDFFVTNKVALRCEARLALVLYRPNSWVTGALSTSPA